MTRYVNDFSGQGGNLWGGRWNSKGRPILYAAPSKSAALLELLAHSDQSISSATESRSFVRILVPNRVSRRWTSLSDLPKGWDSIPATDASVKFGDAWLASAESCVLVVPSIVVPGEHYYLLNPLHRDFEYLEPRMAEPFHSYDAYGEEMRKTGPKEIFLCHASEDKEGVVRPIRDELFSRGISCWLDEAEITLGDSIVEKVAEGLGRAKFVVVFLSPAFLGKKWPKRELHAALNKEARQGVKVVLPIVINYPGQKVDFAKELPLAEDKLYYTWQGSAAAAAAVIEVAVGCLQTRELVLDVSPAKGEWAALQEPEQRILTCLYEHAIGEPDDRPLSDDALERASNAAGPTLRKHLRHLEAEGLVKVRELTGARFVSAKPNGLLLTWSVIAPEEHRAAQPRLRDALPRHPDMRNFGDYVERASVSESLAYAALQVWKAEGLLQFDDNFGIRSQARIHGVAEKMFRS